MLQPYIVIVKFGFGSTEDRDAFTEQFGEAAAHVLEHEPEVLSCRSARCLACSCGVNPCA